MLGGAMGGESDLVDTTEPKPDKIQKTVSSDGGKPDPVILQQVAETPAAVQLRVLSIKTCLKM